MSIMVVVLNNALESKARKRRKRTYFFPLFVLSILFSFFSGCAGEEIFTSAETLRNKEIVKEKCSTFAIFHSEIQ